MTRLTRAAAALAGAVVLASGLAACDDQETETTPKKKTYDVAQGASQPGRIVGVGRAMMITSGPSESVQGLVGVRLLRVREGDTSDLKEFTLDHVVRRSSIYYVTVRLTNRSRRTLPGFRPSLYGQVSETEVVPAVRFGTTFEKCSPDVTTREFGPKATQMSCYVFLVPEHGDLKAVQYRFEEPKWPALTWRLG